MFAPATPTTVLLFLTNFLNKLEHVFYFVLVLFVQWPYQIAVNEGCALGGGVEEPDEQTDFGEVVEGDVLKDKPCEFVHAHEQSVDGPVSEPLFVIVPLLCVQSFDTLQPRVYHAYQIG